MGKPVHPLSNLGLAGEYLSTLPASDISRRYFEGTAKYNSTFFNRFFMFFTINGTLGSLNLFYPYQPIIRKSNQQYNQQIKCSVTTGLVFTAASWFTIFNLARRGKVLPFFSQYGKFFKTHRIFRQYLYSLLAPITILTGLTNWKYLNHTQHLWATHSRRMNQKITSDPAHSEYPKQLLCKSLIGSWQTTFFELPDIQKKRLNETNILLAPDYTPNEWELVQQEKSQEEQE